MLNVYICFEMFYLVFFLNLFYIHNNINVGVRTKSRTLIAERKFSQQLTQMLSKINYTFFRQEALRASWRCENRFGQKPLKLYFGKSVKCWQKKSIGHRNKLQICSKAFGKTRLTWVKSYTTLSAVQIMLNLVTNPRKYLFIHLFFLKWTFQFGWAGVSLHRRQK